MCYHMTAVYDLKDSLLVVPRQRYEQNYELIKDATIAWTILICHKLYFVNFIAFWKSSC